MLYGNESHEAAIALGFSSLEQCRRNIDWQDSGVTYYEYGRKTNQPRTIKKPRDKEQQQ